MSATSKAEKNPYKPSYLLQQSLSFLSNVVIFVPAGRALSVVTVNTLPDTNRKSHNTYDYDQEDVILRRGKEFKIDVTFDRDVDTDKDIITLQFVYGNYIC